MCSQPRNSCAKAFDNRSRSKTLKPEKSREGGGVNLTPFPPLKASRVNNVIYEADEIREAVAVEKV